MAAASDDSNTGSSDSAAKAEFNAAIDKVFNPSDKKGGTIKLANSGDWDTLDPGETYYGYSWNFLRLYGRALLMFKPAPGAEGNELVPDLAEGLGTPSDGGKTWTYKIRPGSSTRTAPPIKSADVKYAVLRSIDKATFPNGPAYFEQFLDLPEGYKGPYKSKGVNTDSAIKTPDDNTIVFHLKKAFGGFDYLAALPQTVPVPEAKDTGAKYKEHVISSGPYMFDKNDLGKSFTLKRNPNWDPATDPNRKALPDGYEVQLNVNADDIDNRLLSGDLDVDVVGTGVQPAALGRVLGDPALKAQTDNPIIAAALVHLDQPDRRRRWTTSSAARPSSTPRTDRLPDRVRRPARRWRHRHHAAAAADPGLPEVRPLPGRRRQQGRRGEGQGGADRLRPAERLRDQHRLPGRAARRRRRPPSRCSSRWPGSASSSP